MKSVGKVMMIESALDARLDILRGTNLFPPGLLERFGKWLATAPEDQVYRINALDWAKGNRVDEDLVIDLFLHATRAGLVEMLWSVLCTQCGMLIRSQGGLRAVSRGKRHCRLCRVEVTGSLDDEIEVDFSVSPGVRRVRYHDPEQIRLREDLAVMYVTPAMRTGEFTGWLRDSFLVEAVIGPKETKVFEFEARSGYQDVFAPAVHSLSYLVGRPEGATDVTLDLYDGQMLPEQVQVKAGPIRVTIHSHLDESQAIGVGFLGDDDDEHPVPNWHIDPYLTGKRLLTSQTFRQLFKADTIDVGTGMQLKRLTVLFTDLQASTAMYERVGDLNALGIVRRHFEVLEQAVAQHRGAVVKTIGDAVMAVFAEPKDAMGAAARMIETVRRAVAHGEDLVLKIGVHQGPCVAIQSNNQVDYFGRTVNIAARVQSLAEGGQIVCSEEIWNAPGVLELVQGRGFAARRETAALKGIEERYPVRRIVVSAVPVASPAKPGRPAAPRSTVSRRAPSGSGAQRPKRAVGKAPSKSAAKAVRRRAARR